jgi:hypothetical protein
MKPFGRNLIRCALILVTLAASGFASATLTYDYTNKVLFDSSTNLYWSSGPKDVGGFEVATTQQVINLFSEVGFSFEPPYFSSPATFSNVVADLVLFFSTGAPSPQPLAGSLPLGDLGNMPPVCMPFSFCSGPSYGVSLWAAWSEPGYWNLIFGYSGSADVGLNDWGTVALSTAAHYGAPNSSPRFALPSGAQFYLVSHAPEPGTWALMLFGLGTLAFVARRRGLAERSVAERSDTLGGMGITENQPSP